MIKSHSRSRLSLVAVAVVAAAALFSPASARAQDAKKVYDLSEVDAMPKMMQQGYVAKIMEAAYPANLKKAGVGGAVQVEFVVDETGKVDPSSIDAISSVPALAEAAKQVAPKIEFSPAKVKGTAVKSRVVLPLVFKP
jgi:periplasmic protein TonB